MLHLTSRVCVCTYCVHLGYRVLSLPRPLPRYSLMLCLFLPLHLFRAVLHPFCPRRGTCAAGESERIPWPPRPRPTNTFSLTARSAREGAFCRTVGPEESVGYMLLGYKLDWVIVLSQRERNRPLVQPVRRLRLIPCSGLRSGTALLPIRAITI